MNTLQYVLYMENQVGLKLLTVTLIEGISEGLKTFVFNGDSSSEKVRLLSSIQSLEDIVSK